MICSLWATALIYLAPYCEPNAKVAFYVGGNVHVFWECDCKVKGE